MENKPQNVFDRLDSIETSQSETQAQNQQILDLLNKINNQESKPNVHFNPRPHVSDQQLLLNFVNKSKKEYVWFGPMDDFNKSKGIINVLCVTLIIVGVLSTIFTSIAFKMYSTYTLFENIWLIFVCILFSYSVNAKKRMIDLDLITHSDTVFIQGKDGIWRDTNKEKKRFRWFRRISYIAVVCNIIVIWIEPKGAITITATLFELAFAGLSFALVIAFCNLFCMYNSFMLITGKNSANTENVTLIYDIMANKISPYEEFNDNLKKLL